ncbi:hypothetical protein CEY16_11390 [Halalkalibacillus sediminis]|uniref:Uncharacterized protein n=1 Tax=Halalkalibacillus sediminis TaxID=2018042 RepID=A0A2I0QT89_9BACI|nr:hypothetical protein [Halalkalibacillus sediminis]PKR77330.1 hypothetical protein CEY16_11390 [Halalkalibacillus sediminis]
MSNITLALLAASIVVIFLYVLLISVNLRKKKNAFTPFTVSLIIISFITVGASLFSIVLEKGDDTVVADDQSENETEIHNESSEEEETSPEVEEEPEAADSEEAEQKAMEFEPGGTEYPIMIRDSDGDAQDIVEDADGTTYFPMSMLTSDGVKLGYAGVSSSIVAFPEDEFKKDERYFYQTYIYFKGGYVQSISENIVSYTDPLVPTYQLEVDSGIQEERYEGLEMGLYEFIYEYLPVQEPEETVDLPLLEGDWISQDENLLKETNTLAKLSFDEEGFLIMENNLINESEVPSVAKYELEPLDTNAYKLYLYPAQVKADSNNGGGVSVSEEPVKRNFLIYLTAEDTFELVFFDEKLNRQSVTMSRQKLN